MFRALLCPSSVVHEYNVYYHMGRFVLYSVQDVGYWRTLVNTALQYSVQDVGYWRTHVNTALQYSVQDVGYWRTLVKTTLQ